MIRTEYLRFLQTLSGDTVTAEERKIANLVPQECLIGLENNCDELIAILPAL